MKIGIDLDDTICRTTEIVHDRVEKYASQQNLNPLDVMNDEVLKEEFFNQYLEDIYTNVEIKRDVEKVLKRLKNKGNEIYIITARSNSFVSTEINVTEITKKWLKEHGIEVEGIITSAYGEAKAKACKRLQLDWMIDDDPMNYKQITAHGIKCILFDDRGKYNLNEYYATTWQEVEKYIERNR